MKLLLFTLSLFGIVGCSNLQPKLLPTNNPGGYTIRTSASNNIIGKGNIVIFGKVRDIKNKQPISNVTLQLLCLKEVTTDSGSYEFVIPHDDYARYYLKAVALGYRTVETDYFNLPGNGKINIDFYLSEDDRPIIDCPPSTP